jgi:NAD-dependent SIR2 family protein deacetylase
VTAAATSVPALDRAAELTSLAELVGPGGVVVLSGAGISTESGIPDYRGPTGAVRHQTPMTYQTFTRDPLARRRYWARSHLGWRTIARAAPNDGHRAVADLQRLGLVHGILTQNVDGLHQAAGARDVIELHGSLDRVVCLDCGQTSGRTELDDRLRLANAGFDAHIAARSAAARSATVKPDGDAELDETAVQSFEAVPCRRCAGMLKPDVVFFGETVPRARVEASFALVEAARTLLVLGSSLTVMSGRRFVLRAAKLGKPVVIVNQGVTRGDGYATLTVQRPLGEILPALAEHLRSGAVAGPGGAG